MKKRFQKIRPRAKIARFKRKKILASVRFLILALALFASLRLGAQRITQTSFLPIYTMRSQLASHRVLTGLEKRWAQALNRIIHEEWRFSNRLTFILSMGALKRDIFKRYPFVSHIAVSWWPLMRYGDLRVRFSFRSALAFWQDKGRSVCMDADAVEFPCLYASKDLTLSDETKPILLELKNLNFKGRETVVKGLTNLSPILEPNSYFVQALGHGGSAIELVDSAGGSILITQETLFSKHNLNIAIDWVKKIREDLRNRGEDFRLIDLTVFENSFADRIPVELR